MSTSKAATRGGSAPVPLAEQEAYMAHPEAPIASGVEQTTARNGTAGGASVSDRPNAPDARQGAKP